MIALVSCEETVEPRLRVAPKQESLWLLVKTQIRLDAIRPELAVHDGRTFSQTRADRLGSELLKITEYLTLADGSSDELRAGGLPALARLVDFIRGQGGAPVYLGVELAGGVGSIRAVSGGGRVLALTVEEAVGLAEAGVMSTAALTVYRALAKLAKEIQTPGTRLNRLVAEGVSQ